MNIDMKAHVTQLLETYPDRERQIALLHYEMRHTACISPEELIGGMSLGHSPGMGGSGRGHISNKTMYIALNYQEQMERMNEESMNEIADKLLQLEGEQDRLRYYVSLLDKREAEVIQMFYMKQMTFEKMEKAMHLTAKTLRKLRNHAVETLATMYEFAGGGGTKGNS